MASAEIKKIGLFGSIAIVAGNMMGSGIALLPSNLAKIGSISIWAWLFAALGALSLAYVFAKLGTDDPQEGGPVAYAGEIAPIFSYQAGLLYYHAGWIGNLAIALTAIAYLSVFFPILIEPIPAGLATIGVIWTFTAMNLLGAHWIGKIVAVGVVLLLIPVLLTSTIGWFYFEPDIFMQNWNVQGSSDYHAIMAAIVLCIWSFIGVESASVSAGLVENPKRNIPLATIIGTSLAALVYAASSTTIIGMFPAHEVAASGAPFSMANAHMFGAWASPVVSAIIAFACLTSLSSWIMMVAEAASRSAQDGTLPEVFSHRNDKNIPVKGLLITSGFLTVLMLTLMVFSNGMDTQDIFGEIVSVTVLFTIIPYFYSAVLMLRNGFAHKAIAQIIVAVIASLFCFTALAGAENNELVPAIIVILGVFMFYVTKDRTKFEANIKEVLAKNRAAQ